MVDNLSIASHAFPIHRLTSLSIDEISFTDLKIPIFWCLFANGLGDRVQSQVESYQRLKKKKKKKKKKIVLDAALLNTQNYKVRIKGKVEQSKEGSSTLPYTSMK